MSKKPFDPEVAGLIDDLDRSVSGADMNACDQEPIHIPGSIQPHGLLLIADGASLKIKAGAGDLENRLCESWLGETLDILLRQDVSSMLQVSRNAGRSSFPLAPVERNNQTFSAVAHLQNGDVLVELEPQPQTPWSALRMLEELDRVASTFERATNLRDLAAAAAAAFRALTGYDRVMVYRFLDDDAGVVIAECCAEDVGSFLHHHFPASDIPKQARALYVRNLVRVIPDTGYAAAPIRPRGQVIETDLSDVAIRSVSPVHLKYLANMNVGASASMSIVKDDLLWGLIACHNRSPLEISYDTRLACKKLASDLARQIRAKEDAGNYRQRARLRASEDTIVARLGGEDSLQDLFANTGDDLRKMLGADGYAAVQGKDVFINGHCPDRDQIFAIRHHFADLASGQPFATDNLGSVYPPATGYCHLASGLIAVTMRTEEPTTLMWFRVEQVEVVNWAGNPHKAVIRDQSTGATILTPRASFDAWSERVHGHSERWTSEEIEAANRLNRGIFEARQNRRMRELNHELAKAKKLIEEVSEAKSQFIANMNHELRTPLSAIIGYAELLDEEAEDLGDAAALFRSDIGKVHTSANHLLHLINGILDISKIEAGKMELELEQFDLAPLAQEVVDTISTLIKSKNNKFKVEVADNILPMYSDRMRVKQCLMNLLSNAGKFTSNGDVTLTIIRDGDYIKFIVTDTGVGMTPAQVSKLFNRFSQADASTTRQFGGTGLGLAITKEFADILGGGVSVRSIENKGTTFELTLPFRTRPLEGASGERNGPTTLLSGACGPRIVVIDDEPLQRDLIGRFLARQGFAVSFAADGIEGLRLSERLQPSAILLDVHMPLMDGWSVLTALKDSPQTASIPVIMITVADERARGMALGADDFLTKPIDWKRLRRTLLNHIPPGARQLALLFEGEHSTNNDLKVRLGAEGWEIISVQSLSEARKEAGSNYAILCIVDLQHTGADGLNFLCELQTLPECEKRTIIAMTGGSSQTLSALTKRLKTVLESDDNSHTLDEEIERCISTRERTSR